MHSMLRMVRFHQTAFGIKDSPLAVLMKALVVDVPGNVLECAVKITPGGRHAAIIRLGYLHQCIPNGFRALNRFLDRAATCGVAVNRSILDAVVNEVFDRSRVDGIGIDGRRDHLSKVKCYFLLTDYPEKARQVMALHPPMHSFENYPNPEIFLFGVDMYADGQTKVEIYPYILENQLEDPRWLKRLDIQQPLLPLVRTCNCLHVSFETDGRRVFHFHPRNPLELVRLINHRRLTRLYGNVRILNLLFQRWQMPEPPQVTLSLLEEEILSRNISRINLQYAMTCQMAEPSSSAEPPTGTADRIP